MEGYLELIEELPLSAGNGKVSDGVRYHVLDVWVDGLVGCEGWRGTGVMRPVERLGREGRTKVVRTRVRGVLGDERLREEEGEEDGGGGEEGSLRGSGSDEVWGFRHDAPKT